MIKLYSLLFCILPVFALAEPCLPCPQPVCTNAVEIPIDHGYCAPNWVMVTNPHGQDCKNFGKDMADLCAQCQHNIRPPWCNRPHPRGYEPEPVKTCPEVSTVCPECPTNLECLKVVDTKEAEPLRAQIRLLERQIELLRKQAKIYKDQIRKLKAK